MLSEFSLVGYTAIGTIFLYCKWGRTKIRVYGLSGLFDIWTTEQTRLRLTAELIVFVALGCILAMGIVEPKTPIQALAAGVTWTSLLAAGK